MNPILYYTRRYKDHIFVYILVWLFFTLMFVESAFGKDFYVSRDLVYFWDFNDESNYESDRKMNVDGFSQGKVKWVPPEFSFHKSGVIHIHGDKNRASSFLIPSDTTKKDLSNWTIDFEVAFGTHAIDHEDHAKDRGELSNGDILSWGDLNIYFVEDPGGAEWKGVIIINYRGRKEFIEEVKGFDYYYMTVRSEESGISIWLDSYCTDYIETPRTSVVGEEIKFGGGGFAGRFDDIKLYNSRLRPWEITANYWGETFNIKKKDNLITSWGKLKYQY